MASIVRMIHFSFPENAHAATPCATLRLGRGAVRSVPDTRSYIFSFESRIRSAQAICRARIPPFLMQPVCRQCCDAHAVAALPARSVGVVYSWGDGVATQKARRRHRLHSRQHCGAYVVAVLSKHGQCISQSRDNRTIRRRQRPERPHAFPRASVQMMPVCDLKTVYHVQIRKYLHFIVGRRTLTQVARVEGEKTCPQSSASTRAQTTRGLLLPREQAAAICARITRSFAAMSSGGKP